MTFIISDLYKLAQSRFATRVKIESKRESLNLLIDANGTHLAAWMLGSAQGQHLNMKFSLDTGSEVLALSRIGSDGGESEAGVKKHPQIAVLFDNRLEVFDVTPSAFAPSLVIPFNAVSGHMDSLEIDPVLLLYSAENNLLILYRYTGFVTVFNLSVLMKNTEKSTAQSNTRKRGRKITPEWKTFSIGTVAVVLMAISESGNKPLIAVLYRDIDYNYSLRYYTFDAELRALTMMQQMEEFSGTPSHVTAVKNGFLVAGDLKMWFFPFASKSVMLADDVGDAAFPVSYSKLHNIVTLNLAAHSTPYIGSRFDSSCQIDECRYMLVSDTGATLIVYLDVQASHAISKVTQFQVVDLGKSTLASELVHLEDNVFYACSRRSRSVLFRILPQAPHIDILSRVTNASPVLSLDFQSIEDRNTVLMSRGGFHGGELEVLTDTEFEVKRKRMTQVTLEASSASLLNCSGSDYVVLKDDVGSTLETLNYPNITQAADLSDIPNGNSSSVATHIGGDILLWNIDEERTIEIKGGEETQITLKSERSNHSLSFSGLDQVTGLEWRENGQSLEVYIALWNGTLSHILFSRKAELVGQYSTGLLGKLSLGILDLDDSLYQIIVLNGEGLLQCIPVSRLGPHKNKFTCNLEKAHYIKAKSSSGAFKMSTSISRGLLIYDSLSLFLLTHEGTCAGLKLSKVLLFTPRIRSCQLAKHSENSGTFLVLFEDGTLRTYTYKRRLGKNDAYGSSCLILLSVTISNRYTVALQLETLPNLSTGQMENVQSLLLFDRKSLKLLDVYKPSKPANFVAMCSMDGKFTLKHQDYIIVANSTDDPLELLKVFCVQLDKLVPVDISINGTMPQTFSLAKIACYKDTVTVVGDIIIPFTLKFTKVKGHEVWKSRGLSLDRSPFFGVDVAGNRDFWVVADAVRGMFVAPRGFPGIFPIRCPFQTTFGSAVAALKTLPILVYGDSDGNIWAARMKKDGEKVSFLNELSFELLFFTNLGEQINEISVILEDPITILVATVKGNVFRVQDLAPHVQLQAYVDRLEGEDDAAVTVSNENRIFRENSFNLIEFSGLDALKSSAENGPMPQSLQIELAELYSDLRLL